MVDNASFAFLILDPLFQQFLTKALQAKRHFKCHLAFIVIELLLYKLKLIKFRRSMVVTVSSTKVQLLLKISVAQALLIKMKKN